MMVDIAQGDGPPMLTSVLVMSVHQVETGEAMFVDLDEHTGRVRVLDCLTGGLDGGCCGSGDGSSLLETLGVFLGGRLGQEQR